MPKLDIWQIMGCFSRYYEHMIVFFFPAPLKWRLVGIFQPEQQQGNLKASALDSVGLLRFSWAHGMISCLIQNHSKIIQNQSILIMLYIYIYNYVFTIHIYSYIHIICYEHSLRFSWNLTIPQLATRTGEFAAGISASASKFAGAPLGWRPLK